jgi:hypothetical protein
MGFRLGTSAKLTWSLLLGFAMLSAADFLLTWKLISANDRAVESNPLAAWWLESYGWEGMASYKLAMFLFIGGLVGVVAWRRPRAAELLLVFGCGAQGAVVLTSFLYAQFDKETPATQTGTIYTERPPMLPRDPIALLMQKPVQDELKLSQSHLEGIAARAKKRQQLLRGIRQGRDLDVWSEKLECSFVDDREWTQEALSLAQKKRLWQLDVQQRGVLALTDPDFCQALAFTDEQQASLNELVQQAKDLRTASPKGLQAKHIAKAEQIQQQVYAQLTKEQLARWRQLAGTPFESVPAGTLTVLFRDTTAAAASP